MILQIKRFSYGKYSKQKLNNRIKVPTTLDLQKFITISKHSTVKQSVYDLVGIVNHSGDINFGHYTAECKNSINEKWYNFNDSTVSETRINSMIESSSPYLLFYWKK
jgi:ubiquitin C-terminal hydrolase